MAAAVALAAMERWSGGSGAASRETGALQVAGCVAEEDDEEEVEEEEG